MPSQKVEEYDIDHAPIMPNFAIPADFGTEEEYRSRITEKELFDEFTRDENGNVVLSEEEAHDKIATLGGLRKTVPNKVRGRLPAQARLRRRGRALRHSA